MSAIESAIDALARVCAWVAVASLVAIVVMLTAEIGSRLLTGASIPIAWEYSSYLLGLLIFTSLGWTLRTGGHIRVALVRDFLPAGWARLLEILAAAYGTVLSSALALALVMLAWDSWVGGSRSFSIAETLLAPPQAAMAAGAWVFALQMVLRLLLALVGRPLERSAPASLQGEE